MKCFQDSNISDLKKAIRKINVSILYRYLASTKEVQELTIKLFFSEAVVALTKEV